MGQLVSVVLTQLAVLALRDGPPGAALEVAMSAVHLCDSGDAVGLVRATRGTLPCLRAQGPPAAEDVRATEAWAEAESSRLLAAAGEAAASATWAAAMAFPAAPAP